MVQFLGFIHLQAKGATNDADARWGTCDKRPTATATGAEVPCCQPGLGTTVTRRLPPLVDLCSQPSPGQVAPPAADAALALPSLRRGVSCRASGMPSVTQPLTPPYAGEAASLALTAHSHLGSASEVWSYGPMIPPLNNAVGLKVYHTASRLSYVNEK